MIEAAGFIEPSTILILEKLTGKKIQTAIQVAIAIASFGGFLNRICDATILHLWGPEKVWHHSHYH